MENILNEEYILPRYRISGLNILKNTQNQVNNLKTQPAIGSEECLFIKLTSKTNLNIKEEKINALKLSHNKYIISRGTEDKISI